MTAHWGIEDPAAVERTDLQKHTAFLTAFAFRYLKNRISAFNGLPIQGIDKLSLGGNPERDRGENSADGLPGKRVQLS
jgi:arsenate reductase